MYLAVYRPEPFPSQKHELSELCDTWAEHDDLRIPFLKMLRDGFTYTSCFCKGTTKILILFLEPLHHHLVFYSSNGLCQPSKLLRCFIESGDVFRNRQDSTQPRFLKLHGIGHVPVEHLVRHVPPAIRVSDRGGGEADHLGALVRIEDVRNTLSPFLRTAVVKLVCNHNVVTGNLLTASCCHHRRAVCHELQVLGREPWRNLGKVRHLVVEHVIVGAEQQEPLVRVVLHHLCEDDELSRSGRLDDAGAVALPKHI